MDGKGVGVLGLSSFRSPMLIDEGCFWVLSGVSSGELWVVSMVFSLEFCSWVTPVGVFAALLSCPVAWKALGSVAGGW